MSRICIVGNSHIAALKLGWNGAKDHFPGIDLTFFGVPGRSLRNVDVAEGKLRPSKDKDRRSFERTSGGTDTIDVSAYDAITVAGLELSVLRWIKLYKDVRHPPFDLDLGTPQVLDREGFEACRRNVFAGTSGQVVFDGLRRAGARRVHVIPQPFPSARIRETEPFWASLLEQEDCDLVERAYRDDLARAFPEAASIEWQPEATRDGALLTQAAFSLGSRRMNLTGAHGDDDVQHMNAEYGARVLASFFGNAGLGGTAGT